MPYYNIFHDGGKEVLRRVTVFLFFIDYFLHIFKASRDTYLKSFLVPMSPWSGSSSSLFIPITTVLSSDIIHHHYASLPLTSMPLQLQDRNVVEFFQTTEVFSQHHHENRSKHVDDPPIQDGRKSTIKCGDE